MTFLSESFNATPGVTKVTIKIKLPSEIEYAPSVSDALIQLFPSRS